MIGLREWFSQTDKRNALPRIPVMVNMASTSFTSEKNQKPQESSDQLNATSRNSMMMDEYSDEDEEFQAPETEQEVCTTHLLLCFMHIPSLNMNFAHYSGILNESSE